jgi:hypothetical protein
MPARLRMAAALAATGAITAIGLAAAQAAAAQPTGPGAYLSHFHEVSTIVSTVPANGDLNPYGIFVVRQTTGHLRANDVLISNFNNKANKQGTGSTIVEISPSGHRSLFASIKASKLPGSCPGGVGLTTALVVLPGGWVVVGSTPSANGLAATAKAGCLIVLNSMGKVKETISGHGINGPWDATAVQTGDGADVFVTNVLNGTVAGNGKVVHRGTVLRLKFMLAASGPPRLVASKIIARGYAEQTNASAFVLGPTGIGLGRHDTLYVAETDTSRIFAIHDALTRPGGSNGGTVLTMGGRVNMPLGLAIAPNGDVLTVNAANGKIVETTPAGAQIASRLLDNTGTPKGAGALFGLAVLGGDTGVLYVDDDMNTLRLLH